MCVLPGNPSSHERRKFDACMEESKGKSWIKYVDENNGNVVMVCHEEDE